MVALLATRRYSEQEFMTHTHTSKAWVRVKGKIDKWDLFGSTCDYGDTKNQNKLYFFDECQDDALIHRLGGSGNS